MEKRPGNIEKGIQLTLGKIRDLRVEAAEERRRSDERFERMFKAFEARSQKSDRRFEETAKGTAHIGRRILRTLENHGRMLHAIFRTLHTRLGGPGGNGGRRNGR